MQVSGADNALHSEKKVKLFWMEKSSAYRAYASTYNAEIISNIQKCLAKDSMWIIDSAIYHTINTSTYNNLVGSSYMKFPKELEHPKKVWIILKILMIIKNWIGVYSDTYILHIIIQQDLERNVDKLFGDELDFEFPNWISSQS